MSILDIKGTRKTIFASIYFCHFIFLGSKTTVDGDWSPGIKRCLLLVRKAMTNLASILKSRDISLLTKAYVVKTMVFPVVMYRCESWAIKTEHWRIGCFWTVVLEKTLGSPLDSKEIQPVHPKVNQSWIFIGRTDAEAPMLWLPAGGEGDNRVWDGWMASLTQCTWVWANCGRYWRTGRPGMLQSTGSQEVGHDWATEQQQEIFAMDGAWSFSKKIFLVLFFEFYGVRFYVYNPF